jgi:KDO2-lipid IV(A) lauroyltransferase
MVGARLTRAMPLGVRSSAAAFGGAMWWAVDAGRRHNAQVNYSAVLGLPEDHPEVRRVARLAFENYGRMLADFLLIGSLRPDEVHAMVTFDGLEHADAALEGGGGAVLALPHMGSWDFAGSLAGSCGYRVAAVADTFPGSLNDVVVQTRAMHGVEIIPLGRSTLRAIESMLDRNGLVALLCDLPHGAGVDVRFFGRRAMVPSGPAAIARRRGVAILPVYSWRKGNRSYHIHVDPPIHPDGGRRRDPAAVAGLMQQVIQRFEVFIRQHPDQWYPFRRILL